MKLKTCVLAVVMLAALVGCGAMSPDADPGENQAVTLGETVTLSAAGSDKKNGDDLSYQWTIVSAPAGSTAQISDPGAAEPTFTPDMVGTYVFDLIVNNDWHDSEPAQVTIRCTAPGAPAAEPVVKLFAADPSGEITLWDMVPVENFRNATHVNFRVEYTLKNAGATRANVGFFAYGLDADGNTVFSGEIQSGIDSKTVLPLSEGFGAALTIAEYDSITEWSVDEIAVFQ